MGVVRSQYNIPNGTLNEQGKPNFDTYHHETEAAQVTDFQITAQKIIAASPAFFRREDIPVAAKTAVTLKPLWVNINGNGYILSAGETIDLTNAENWDDGQYTVAAKRAGKDFYIYACEPTKGDAPILKLSANSTYPTGYNENNSRKIGGFHCLCVDVGTISGHTLSGYVAGDILPLSMWDLKHRPVSSPEGMVYVNGVGKWIDIYKASWNGTKLVSEYNKTIADGTSSPAFHGEKFAEEFGKIGKSLLWRDEFIVVAKGSNENTAIYGAADPNTTGGHKDTAQRRMISNYGLEDCCGVLWEWGRDCYEFYPGATWNPTTNQYLAGYSYQDSPVYYAGTDPQKYGQCYGLLRRVRLGGNWTAAAYCGSRCASCASFSAHGGTANVGARGASEPRRCA